MCSPETVALRDTLAAAEVTVRPERRGFNTRKGVPDAVVWVGPDVADDMVCAPVLFELESVGGEGSVTRDVSEFASRGDHDDHRYHLIWPTNNAVDNQPVTVNVQYQVQTVPSATVTGEYDTSERTFYRAVKRWATRRLANASPTCTIATYAGVEVIRWAIQTQVYGHDLEVRVPIIASTPPGMTPQEIASVIERRDPPLLTMFGIIDGRPAIHTNTCRHETTVKMQQILDTCHSVRQVA